MVATVETELGPHRNKSRSQSLPRFSERLTQGFGDRSFNFTETSQECRLEIAQIRVNELAASTCSSSGNGRGDLSAEAAHGGGDDEDNDERATRRRRQGLALVDGGRDTGPAAFPPAGYDMRPLPPS